MSFKTERLVDLFPDAYAAGDRGSVLYKLLDAFGAGLMDADSAVKSLLKSHWVDYAQGSALDRLGATFGVERRVLAGGGLEGDEAFRARLGSIVSLYTGGGTVEAVKGAVRSALGLPYNLDQLKLPPAYSALRADIEALVQVHEFSPKVDKVQENTVVAVPVGTRANAAQLTALVNASTVSVSLPRIELTADMGTLTRLSVRCVETNAGFRSLDSFVLPRGQTVVFTAAPGGGLSALVEGRELASRFVALVGNAPAAMPAVPAEASRWVFQAQGGLFDVASFDAAGADLPAFHVVVSRVVYEPLTFDVQVPFFLQESVRQLKRLHRYGGDILVFEGIAPHRIQQVVNQTRAAGVRGAVQFTLHFLDDQAAQDSFAADWQARWRETQDTSDTMTAANTNDYDEDHATRDRLTLAGVFDVSRFEGPFGYL